MLLRDNLLPPLDRLYNEPLCLSRRAVTAGPGDLLSPPASLVEPASDWARCTPGELPALGGALTDILGEDHGHWSARLFVA